jgi:hypothetical protein
MVETARNWSCIACDMQRLWKVHPHGKRPELGRAGTAIENCYFVSLHMQMHYGRSILNYNGLSQTPLQGVLLCKLAVGFSTPMTDSSL